jgi:hypothetical protein
MNEPPLPTLQDIEKITAYLSRLYADGFSAVVRWHNSEKGSDGAWSVPYPDYDPLVEEFFREVSRAWLDYAYDPEQAYHMLKDEDHIERASLVEIKTMLTFCVRGERFSDGHWEEMIQKGYIRRLLERLNTIKDQLRKDGS